MVTSFSKKEKWESKMAVQAKNKEEQEKILPLLTPSHWPKVETKVIKDSWMLMDRLKPSKSSASQVAKKFREDRKRAQVTGFHH